MSIGKRTGVTPDLYAALSAFQAEVVTVPKTGSNPFFKSSYATLDGILKAALPVLSKHGLAVVQLPSYLDGHPALRTVITHTSGQSIEGTAPLSLVKDDPQSQGSAITYLRRYALAGALGIVIDEDDDGNATREPNPVHTSGPASSPQVKKIQALFTGKGITDRDDKLNYLSEFLQRPIESSKELTASEASRVIESLTK
jgi:hypothetical protein